MVKSRRAVPRVGLSLMMSNDFLEAAQPLFANGDVDVLEWSFDTGWGMELPAWVNELLSFYSQKQRLIGHGVSYSLLSGQGDHEAWLAQLQQTCQQHRYQQISEHFGWMQAGAFQRSSPLPLPLTPATLKLGQQRLQRLASVAKHVPVGLENLAFAFGEQDVQSQGEFLEQLLAPVDGFLVLDLHNLFCQMHNFGYAATAILSQYPLQRVKEIHISGGSWSPATGERQPNVLRRDTHDEAVPLEVFELFTQVLPQCPNLETVIFERLGHTMPSSSDKLGFQDDFYQIKQICEANARLVC
jgi:uncharacterized protein